MDENTQNNTEMQHRRKGGAYDTLAKVLRNITKAVFGTGTVIEDRPGRLTKDQVENPASFVKSKSVFEIYQQKEALKDQFNLMFIGRKGTGDYNYTNQIVLAANSKSIDDGKLGNGYVGFELDRDGTQYAKAKIALYEGNIAGLPGYGARAEIIGEGDAGGVQLTYYRNIGDVNPAAYIILDKDGFQTFPNIVSKSGHVNFDGSAGSAFPSGWTCSNLGAGSYRVTHNLGTTDYVALVSLYNVYVSAIGQSSNYFDVSIMNVGGTPSNCAFNFVVY